MEKVGSDNQFDVLISCIHQFHEDTNGEYSRYKSWEYCYKHFGNARNKVNTEEDYDSLSLQLAFYLASWGMYRGSSFLLQTDYKVHIPVVKKILEPAYDTLFNFTYKDLRDMRKEEINRLADRMMDILFNDLIKWMKQYYEGIRTKVANRKNHDLEEKTESAKNDLSNILVTKILLGTLGCTPAYDEYFVKGIKNRGENYIQPASFGRNSLKDVIRFYWDHKDRLEQIRKSYIVDNDKTLPYPQMKIIDMGFWRLGKRIKEEEATIKPRKSRP